MIGIQTRVANERIYAKGCTKAAQNQAQNPSSVSSPFLHIGEDSLSAVWTDDFSGHVAQNEQRGLCTQDHRVAVGLAYRRNHVPRWLVLRRVRLLARRKALGSAWIALRRAWVALRCARIALRRVVLRRVALRWVVLRWVVRRRVVLRRVHLGRRPWITFYKWLTVRGFHFYYISNNSPITSQPYSHFFYTYASVFSQH
jgi:hypothetical protein